MSTSHRDRPSSSPDELARALHLTIGRVARTLRRGHRRGELTLSEASLLARIETIGPTTPGALAQSENVRPQAIAATLSALETMGFVRRDPDPEDGRRTIVSLTDQGHALRQERRNESTERLAAAIAETISTAELPALREAVALIARVADAL